MRTSPQCAILSAARALVPVLLGACAVSLRAESTIGFSDAIYDADETFEYVPILVGRIGDEGTVVTVEFATQDNTAMAGEDYEPRHLTLEFLAGETDKVVQLPILNDGIFEPLETFQVNLANPSAGAILGGRTSVARVSVKDNDRGIQLAMASYTVNEDAGMIVLEVVRWDDGEEPVTVDYETTDLTGIAGEDYVATSGTLTIAAGRVLQAFEVPILDDLQAESSENFRVQLSDPSAGGTLGEPISAVVTITDTDQAIEFCSEFIEVPEQAAFVELEIIHGQSDTVGSVLLSTFDLTATSGEDYTDTATEVVFEAGQGMKRVRVPIVQDGTKESNEQFEVRLSDPVGGAVVGAKQSVVVTILDDDQGVAFSQTSVAVLDDEANVTVAVRRGNDTRLGPFTVDYATQDGTAIGGVDYVSSSGTLSFAEGETLGSITVPLLRNPDAPGSHSFQVTLSNVNGDATLAGRTPPATVQVLDATMGRMAVVAPLDDPQLLLDANEDEMLISWEGGGAIHHAEQIDGAWEEVLAAESPLGLTSRSRSRYFRVAHPRPADVFVPSAYDEATPLPLLLVLHGYAGDADRMREVYRFEALAESYGFLACHAQGTIDVTGNRFFSNANEACCDWYQSGVDDSAYLRELIEEISRRFRVDPKRIFATGASNGANMVHRLATDHADLIAAIASVGGMTFLEPSKCQPSEPVNILHIHGSADTVLPYDGGYLNRILPGPPQTPVPGTPRSFRTWGRANGCNGLVIDPEKTMDLDLDVPGLDASVTRYAEHPPGGAVELWTIHDGWHAPTIYQGDSNSELSVRIVEWLLDHPKP